MELLIGIENYILYTKNKLDLKGGSMSCVISVY